MKYYRGIILTLAAAGLAACSKPAAPGPEKPPQPHMDAAAQVGVSTAGAIGQALNAPGNYMRGMVGNIDKAKQAAAEANRKAEAGMELGAEYTGGK